MTRGAAVAIVGGGVTGLSAGWWLAREGVDVLVIEKGIVGWEASGRNGGGCTHAMSPLFAEEQRLWPQMDALLGYPTEFQPNRVRVFLDERQREFAARGARAASRHGFKADPLDAKQLKELVPVVTDRALGGLFTHYGGHANPQRTVQAYAWALQDAGGRILQHAEVTGFETRGGRVAAVVTASGAFGCESVVLAAGPQTGRMAAMLGAHVPTASARVEMMVTEPLPAMFRGGIDGNGLYGRQTLRGNLVYGGGPHEWIEPPDAGTAPQPATPLIRNLARRLAELLPGAAHARVLRGWAGIVENTPDGLPVIDRLADPGNVVVATLSSVGFGLSPASGRAIADLARHGRCTFADLSALRLSRFGNLAADWRRRQGWAASPA